MKITVFTQKELDEKLEEKAREFQSLQSGERHPKLFGLGMLAYHAGYDDVQSLRDYLVSVYNGCSGQTDFVDCNSTAKHIVEIQGIGYGREVKERPVTQKIEHIEQIIEAHRKYWNDFCSKTQKEQININDEGDLSNDELANRRLFIIKSLCGDLKDDFLFIGNQRSDKQETSYLDRKYDNRLINWSPLYCANPLTKKERKKDNCRHVNYLVLEIDEPLAEIPFEKGTEEWMEAMEDQQMRFWNYILNHSSLPISTLVYSGSKSIHALIAVDATPKELQDHKDELVRLYSELHFDRANIDCVRKTRMPFGIRWFAKGVNGHLIDIDKAKQLVRLSSSSKDGCQEASKTLQNAGINPKRMERMGRLQDCLYHNSMARHIKLEEFIKILQEIVDSFVPVIGNKFGDALDKCRDLPMTQENFEEYLKWTHREIYTDDITRLPVCTGFNPNDINTVCNQIMDDWYRLNNHFPSIEKIRMCKDQCLIQNKKNPVLEWLTRLSWDGLDRLETIYKILHIENDELSKILVRKWLIQTVAIIENGDSNIFGIDGVLTFLGAQGCGKTSFFRKLVPSNHRSDWFAEGCSLDTENTDSLRQLTRGWIMELGEVDYTTKKEQAALKAKLTASIDSIRGLYQLYPTQTFRHVSICASVNKEDYLRDETGNRRWWSIIIKDQIDLAEMDNMDISQLWAQIKSIWDSSDKVKQDAFRLSEDEQAKLASRNEGQRTDTGFENDIREHFNFKADKSKWKFLTINQIASVIIDGYVCKNDKINLRRSLEALKLKKINPQNVPHYMMPPEYDSLEEKHNILLNGNVGDTFINDAPDKK